MTVAPEDVAYGGEQWLEFFAHLHPLLLHLPIGLLFAVGLLEFVTLFSPGSVPARRWLWAACGVTAILAAASGWFLGAPGGDYSGAMVDEHRKFGIAASVAAAIVATLDVFGRSARVAAFRRIGFVVVAGLITATGHRGGMMTHGRTFLSEHAPPWLAPYVGIERERRPVVTEQESDVVEATALVPAEPVEVDEPEVEDEPEPQAAPPRLAMVVAAFRDRCNECHDENKSKGGLRLDVAEGWHETIDLDSPIDSELLYRVMLPGDDIDAMPPKGDRLDDAVIAQLRAWIEDGAPEEELEAQLVAMRADVVEKAAEEERAAVPTGADVRDVPGRDGKIEVSWSHARVAPTAERIAALAPLADRIEELSLAGTAVDDDALAALPDLPVLRRVHAERTSIGDAGVAHIVAHAPALEYLNLHSTRVTAGVRDVVAEVESLRELVVFGTAAAEEVDDPFDGLDVPQPRRILVVSAEKNRAFLYTELAVGRPKVVWEREVAAGTRAEWLGGTTGPHGNVLLRMADGSAEVVDTATNTAKAPSGGVPEEQVTACEQPLANGNEVHWNVMPADGEPFAVEKEPDGTPVWSFDDRERLGARLTSLAVIERTAPR